MVILTANLTGLDGLTPLSPAIQSCGRTTRPGMLLDAEPGGGGPYRPTGIPCLSGPMAMGDPRALSSTRTAPQRRCVAQLHRMLKRMGLLLGTPSEQLDIRNHGARPMQGYPGTNRRLDARRKEATDEDGSSGRAAGRASAQARNCSPRAGGRWRHWRQGHTRLLAPPEGEAPRHMESVRADRTGHGEACEVERWAVTRGLRCPEA